MQQRFLARGQLLLMMALGGLAQNVDHEGVQIHQFYPTQEVTSKTPDKFAGTLRIDENDENFKELVNYSSGFMACFVLGFMLALVLPWVGICLFCSRLHGCCCGQRYHKYKPDRHLWRKELTCAAVFFTILLWYIYYD
ncbi:hypothetical protein LSAT2_025494 [Lamellibrachia satsuma]|nr:hypothetical protein LSAT2_025494 [Lamellibrachia satsuma]